MDRVIRGIAGRCLRRPWFVGLLSFVLAAGGGIAPRAVVAQTEGGSPAPTSLDPGPTIEELFTRPTPDRLPDAAAGLVVDVPLPAPAGATDESTFVADAWAAVAALPAEEWDLDALATALGDDPVAAFSYVRDAIRYEPYPGVLRDAAGTLAARAGNSYDRALLLGDILSRTGHTVRYALGDLDVATAAQLVRQSLQPPTIALTDAPDLALMPLEAEAVARRAARDYALLLSALGPRADALSAGGTLDDAVILATDHAWVQVEEAGGWLDLDPSLPAAAPGDTLAAVREVLPAFTEAQRQAVTVRVVVHSLIDDQVYEQVVLEQRLDAAGSTLRDAHLLFLPVQGSGGVGLFGGVGAGTTFAPVFAYGDSVAWGTAFQGEDVVDESGGLGFGGGGSSYLLGVDIGVQLEVLGQAPVAATRTLLDRVPAAARAAGVIDPAGLLPLQMGPNGPEALSWIHHLMVSNGGSNPVDRVLEQGEAVSLFQDEVPESDLSTLTIGALLWPQDIADRALVVGSERVALPAADVPGRTHAFVGRPRVYLASIGPDPSAVGSVAQRTDLLLDGIEVLAAGDDAAHVRIWYGALMTALETEHGLLMLQGVDPSVGIRRGVSLAMAESAVVLGPDDLPGLPPDAPASLRAIAESGGWAIVPGPVDGARVWWEVDATGATRSMLAPGLGGWEVFPGTGKASIYHFKKPGSGAGPRPSGHEKPTAKVKAQPGNEYELIVGGVAIPGEIAVTWLGTALAFLVAIALDYLLTGGEGFRCHSCGRAP